MDNSPDPRSVNARPVILVFSRYYLPGFKAGGPLRTIDNMVKQLGSRFEFRIVALDRDLGDTERYQNIVAAEWNQINGAFVRYLSPEETSLAKIIELIKTTPHELVYLNSFFDSTFTQKPLLARWLGLAPRKPYVIAPRGEFSKGALTLKARKKNVFLRLAQLSGLYKGLTWQATSNFEANDIRRSLPATADNICIAQDLTSSPNPTIAGQHQERADRQALRVCFVSRISPKKNLAFALEILNQVRTPVRFTIYGPAEDTAYWARCQLTIDKLPKNIQTIYRGPLDPSQVSNEIVEHDLFFLPTRGENFGHVIAESLYVGTPVLISDQTPWRGLLAHGAGWDLPLDDPNAFVDVITEMASWPRERMVKLRRTSLEYAARFLLSDAARIENELLFAKALLQKDKLQIY